MGLNSTKDAAGATLLCGGKRTGAMLEATLLENVPDSAKICAEETFGPVAVLSSFSDFDDALARVNASRFGLQAGIFTRDFYKVKQAWNTLEVGGVVIGDVPSYRVDNMPYGGVKDSGLARAAGSRQLQLGRRQGEASLCTPSNKRQITQISQ